MTALFRRIRSSAFARNVGVLATGSLFAQAIGMASAPVVTRLYAPAEYASLALFLTIVGTMAPAVAGRYDSAIVIARRDADRDTLLALSMWVAAAVSLIVFVVWLLTADAFVAMLNAETLGAWWWAIPPFLLVTSAATSLRFFANRHEHYTLISRVAMTQAIVGAAVTIGLGLWGLRRDGQIIGATVGLVASFAIFVAVYGHTLRQISWRFGQSMWNTAKRYKDFPLYGATTTFLDCITAGLPVLMMTKFFPSSDVGQYALGVRVFSAPLSFIATSVSQVHMRKAADLVATSPSVLPKYTHTLALSLLAIACVPAAVLAVWGEDLFALVFGPSWKRAGEFLVILLPALVVKFVASAVSGVFAATGNLRMSAAWKTSALVVTAGGLSLGTMWGDTVSFLRCLLVVDLVLYGGLYAAIAYSVSRVHRDRLPAEAGA